MAAGVPELQQRVCFEDAGYQKQLGVKLWEKQGELGWDFYLGHPQGIMDREPLWDTGYSLEGPEFFSITVPN